MCLICAVIGLGKHGYWVGLSGLKESFTPSHKGQMDQEKIQLIQFVKTVSTDYEGSNLV